MARQCVITGKRSQRGNRVSHAHNKTRRRWLPNLHRKRIWNPSTSTFSTLRVSARGLRTIHKIGLEAALRDPTRQSKEAERLRILISRPLRRYGSLLNNSDLSEAAGLRL